MISFKRTKAAKKDEGFVLIEILSAMVILGIATIGFMHIVQASAFNSENSLRMQSAHYFAVQMIDEQRTSGFEPGVTTGKDELTGLYWEMRIIETENEFPLPTEIAHSGDIFVTIWAEDKDNPEAELSTRLIYGDGRAGR